MNRADILSSNLTNFYKTAATVIEADESYVKELLKDIDFEELSLAIREHSRPVYRYNFTVDNMPEEERVSERLLKKKACKVWSYIYRSLLCGKDLMSTVNVEFWLCEDMSIALIVSHVANYRDYESVSVYRELINEYLFFDGVEVDLEDISMRLKTLAKVFN